VSSDSVRLRALTVKKLKDQMKPTLEFLVFTSAPLAISSRARADSPTLTALMSSNPSCFCEARTAACADR
jgi:hypothetical protein